MRQSARLRSLLARGLILFSLCTVGPNDASAAPHVATTTTGSALAQLAQLVSRIVIDEPSLVAFAPLQLEANKGEVPLSSKAQRTLHQALVRVVGSSVGGARFREHEALTLTAASLRARRANLALVYLEPLVVGGFLEIDVQVVKWPRSFWQRAMIPSGTVSHHASFRVAADAQIRRHLPPAPGLLSRKTVYPSPMAHPSALACGDMNADGGSELLLVDRHQVLLGRFHEGAFHVEAERPWSSLSSISSTPLRAPLAAAVINQTETRVGLSDRHYSLLLGPDLKTLRHESRSYPLGNNRCAHFSETGLRSQVVDCGVRRQPRRVSSSDQFSVNALALGRITEENGTVTRIMSFVDGNTGDINIEITAAAQTTKTLHLQNVGDAVAWADLDGDGNLELISSRSTHSPNADALVIHSLEDGKMTKRASLPGGPVHALAICPFSGSNPLSIVAAVGAELWVIR